MRRCMVYLVAAATMGTGCEKPGRQESAASPGSAESQGAGAQTPATVPAISRPAFSTLLIDGKSVRFPAARLVLQQQEPTVELLLFSDDPPNALSAHYDGNRYYLSIKLDIDNLSRLGAAEMHSRAASVEQIDAPDGIYLNGDQQVLQPHDWHVGFAQEERQLMINLSGNFAQFQGREPTTAPRVVFVQGTLLAQLEMPQAGARKPEPASRPTEGR